MQNPSSTLTRDADLDIDSSSPFQLPLPPLPRAQNRRIPIAALPDTASEGTDLRSRSPSVWTAPSPSQRKRTRSPSLPLLPPLSNRDGHRRAITPAKYQKSESSYYTALWGSPYELPSSPSANGHNYLDRSSRSGSPSASAAAVATGSPRAARFARLARHFSVPEEDFEEFSSANLAYTSRKLAGALGGRRDDNNRDEENNERDEDSETEEEEEAEEEENDDEISSGSPFEIPFSALPEEWVRKIAKAKRQNKHWLSDDSGGSDSGSEGEFDDSWLEPGLETPTAKSKKRQKESARVVSGLKNLSKHRRGFPSDSTLTQQDFDTILKSHKARASLARIMSAGEALSTPLERPASNSDKPLPAPPVERTASESPVLTTPVAAPDQQPTLSEKPPLAKRPSISSSTSFQRPKKRVVWRGKACLIALPLENGKDENGDPKRYLQPEEVQAIFDSWKSKGFDTDGFNLSDGSFGGSHQGQSRNIFPDPGDSRRAFEGRDFRVSIPDIKSWNDYKKELQEQKLRALGVSFGEDLLPARESPTLSSANVMSRQMSQSSIAQSLPGAPSSANGFRGMDNGFSPPFPAQPNPFARPSSIMSPDLPQGPPAGFHFPRQSMAFAPGQTFNNMIVPLTAASPLSGSHPTSRGVSPFLDGRRQSIRQTQSPIGILQESSDENYFPGQSSLLPHLRSNEPSIAKIPGQNNVSFNGLHPLVERNEPDIVEPTRFTSHPDIASPMPQGHRHNVSESLQREIDDAEYHLEESIRRQLEEDDEKAQKAADENKEPESEPLVSLATDEAQIESESDQKEETDFTKDAKDDLSEIQTNPSLAPSPKPQPPIVSKPSMLKAHSSHSSKSSVSKLNVNAKEFVFDPTKSFTPGGVFNFGGPSMERQPSGPSFAAQSAHSKTTSNISAFSGNFNASAPSFTPQMVSQTFNIPKHDFSFSQQMPSFNAGAPSFVPGSGLGIVGSADQSADEGAAPKIFDVDLSEMVKPAKKSKAIPIVKPSDSEHNDIDGEDGRIERSESRQKRARRGSGSGDQVPLFATPTRDVSAGLQERSSSVHRRTRSISITRESMASPQAANDQIEATLDDLKVLGSSAPSSSVEEANGVEDADNSGPLEDVGKKVGFDPSINGTPQPEDALKSARTTPAPADDTPTKTSAKKSHLSAAAKSFHFNPGTTSFLPGQPVEIPKMEPVPVKVERKPTPDKTTAPSTAPAKPAKNLFSTGLGASRYAKSPSPEPEKSQSPNPEDSHPAESDGQLRSRIMNGVSYVEPTYQELDDVMQQLNGDDSDIGVERNHLTEWHSPTRSNGSVRRRSSARDDEIPTSDPNQLERPFQYLPKNESGSSDSINREIVAKNARFSPSYRPSRTNGDKESPVNRLNSAEQIYVSDWNDVVDSGDEEKFLSRAAFFDSRVNELVGSVIDKRFAPLEQGLATINIALERLGGRSGSRRYRRSMSAEADDSDADDEDDVIQSRALSPLKDRKFEKLKASIFESIGAQKLVPSQEDFEKITQSLAELKTTLHERSQPSEPTVSGPTSEEFMKLQHNIVELKATLAEQQERVPLQPEPNEDIAQLRQTLAELSTSMKEQRVSSDIGDIRQAIEDAITKSIKEKPEPAAGSLHEQEAARAERLQEAATAEKLQLQVSGLESMLKASESRAEEELRSRRAVEDTLAEVRRSLTVAQTDAAKYRESAEETEESLKSFLNGQQEAKQHTAMLEEVNAARDKNIGDLSEKNSVLEETLDEYRASYREKKNELEEAKAHMKELDAENQNLDKTIREMKRETEEGIQSKKALQDKFGLLQDEMAKTAQTIAKDQSAWRHKEEEHKAKHDLQKARLEAEARTRERLEMEIDRLEKQEKDAMKARFLVEQIRGENNHLVGMVNELRSKNHEVQEHAMKLERDLHDARESSRQEVQRVTNATKSEVAAANQQATILRANLESVIERLESQVEQLKADGKESKHRYESLLEEASAARTNALREAAESREMAMQEHYRFHERTLAEAEASHERMSSEAKGQYERMSNEAEAAHNRAIEELEEQHVKAVQALEAANSEIKATHKSSMETTLADHNRAMMYIKQDHERALHVAGEDKRVVENYLNGRINVATEQVTHLKDRVAHLEERLEIAKAAAQAAADAAKAARVNSPAQPVRAGPAGGSAAVAKGSDLPEKISPQALRESIMVLQEQLHQRESQIEKLEEELSGVDKEAPTKLKEKDVEIAWLRELLGVRLDDLQDIIGTLSSPAYDRDAVRDAAIRLKANLQMEQQEKERAMGGGQRFPSLSSLTQVAASPRSLPMAAAAAWGSWRKGQTSLGSLAEMAAPAGATVSTRSPRGDRSASQTPSKSSPQSFLSGLLTPPASNIRHTPSAGPSSRNVSAPARRGPPAGFSTPKRHMSSSSQENRRALSNLPPPSTPPLLRTESYDQDAESGHYSLDRYVNEDDEAASSIYGTANGSDSGTARVTVVGNNDEPFGPTIELAG